MIVLRQTLTYM